MEVTSDIVTMLTVLSFVPVALLRIALLCREYLLTGTFGNIDNGMFFHVIMYLQSDDEDATSLKGIVKYFFTGVHPLPMLVDFCVYTIFVMLATGFITISVSFPYIPLVFIALGLFILLMKIMRKRIAHKQKFVSNLKGGQINE